MTESRRGPAEDLPCSSTLRALVVSPGPDPHLHGFSLESDLAKNYSFAEVILLTLTGEPPDEEAGKAFEVALSFLSAAPVNEVPGHSALLARTVGSTTDALIGVVAVAAAEEARAIAAHHEPLLAWLNGSSEEPFPNLFRGSEAERSSVERLETALSGTGIAKSIFEQKPSRLAAIVGVLHDCGLCDAAQIQVAITICRIACAAAEGLARKPLDLMDYPLRLPDFEYTDP